MITDRQKVYLHWVVFCVPTLGIAIFQPFRDVINALLILALGFSLIGSMRFLKNAYAGYYAEIQRKFEQQPMEKQIASLYNSTKTNIVAHPTRGFICGFLPLDLVCILVETPEHVDCEHWIFLGIMTIVCVLFAIHTIKSTKDLYPDYVELSEKIGYPYKSLNKCVLRAFLIAGVTYILFGLFAVFCALNDGIEPTFSVGLTIAWVTVTLIAYFGGRNIA